MKTIHYLYLSIFSFFCFFFLTIFIINGNQIFFDGPCYHFLSGFSFTSFFRLITNLGNVFFLFLFVVLSYFCLRKKSDWQFLVCMMVFQLIANLVLKSFFSRPRPSVFHLVEETGFSVPSGHMMASTMFYGLCIYFLMKSSLPKIWKLLGAILFVFLIVSIGMSRIYLGVHYASDIIGGFFISLCFLSFGVFFYQSMHANKKERLL